MVWLLLAGLVGHLEMPVSASVVTDDRPPVRPAVGQDMEAAVTIEDVDITARRGRAKVPPLVEMDDAQIDALGVWTLAEVLDRLNRDHGGTREPLILINGQKVALPSAFLGFPTDAARRLEILPPEAAGLYGGRPGQTVYNLVLQPRYSSFDVTGDWTAPTQGDTWAARLQGQNGRIEGQNMRQLRLLLRSQSDLRAHERRMDDADGPYMAPDTTLRPEISGAQVDGMLTRQLGDWGVNFNVSGRWTQTRSAISAGGQIQDRRSETGGASASVGVSGRIAGWSLTSNASYNWADSRDRGARPTMVTDPDPRQTLSRHLALKLDANRSLLDLPGGSLMAQVTGSHSQYWMQTDQSGSRFFQRGASHGLRGAFNLPVVQPGQAGIGQLGAIQLDVGLGISRDGGVVGKDNSLGISWQPVRKLRLGANFNENTTVIGEAVRLQPITYGDPVTMFDFRNGEAVEVMTLTGGNPNLLSPSTRSLNVTMAVGPLWDWQLLALINYGQETSRDGLGSLSQINAELEAAFPDRFIRDAQGRLTLVDMRPLNLGSSHNERVAANLTFTAPMERLWPEAAEHLSLLQGRVSYSRQLRARIRYLPGMAEVDPLRGDGGGRPQQTFNAGLDMKVGETQLGLGLTWVEGYRNRRQAGVDSDLDLIHADHLLADLRLGWRFRPGHRSARDTTAGEAQTSRRAGGLEISLEVTNLFDTRPEVNLSDGRPAPGFGRDHLDPMGRIVKLGLRRRF